MPQPERPPTAPAGSPGNAPEWSFRAVEELRAVAALMFSRERVGHTLQPTAIVNEAWLRLAQSGTVQAGDRGEFLALAAATIRRVLVDHARRHLAQKRGGGRRGSEQDVERAAGPDAWAEEALALESELELLAKLHPRSAQVCEMRYYGGLSDAEIALRLGVSDRTVRQDWATARAWLLTRLTNERR